MWEILRHLLVSYTDWTQGDLYKWSANWNKKGHDETTETLHTYGTREYKKMGKPQDEQRSPATWRRKIRSHPNKDGRQRSEYKIQWLISYKL